MSLKLAQNDAKEIDDVADAWKGVARSYFHCRQVNLLLCGASGCCKTENAKATGVMIHPLRLKVLAIVAMIAVAAATNMLQLFIA